MIGWIALAGIIVRNSILLVDFAVHEIRAGATVEEAVIKSCKTRTRPILITAFALIFASSVIFFDPIFQGMAISLASGVLVSTLLTLIVIPLGCVQAAGSLCEVAGINCGDRKPEDNEPGKPATAAAIGPFLVKAWRVIATLILAIVGLVGTIIGLLKKRKAVEKKQAAGSTTPPASGSAPVTRNGPAPVNRDAPAPAANKAPAPVTRDAQAAAEPTKQEASSTAHELDAVPAAAASGAVQPAKTKAAGNKKPARAKTGAVDRSKAKTAAKKNALAKKALVTKKKVSKKVSKKVVTKKAVTTRGRRKIEAKPEPKPEAKKVSKATPGRRGIRLKNMNDSNDDGLS